MAEHSCSPNIDIKISTALEIWYYSSWNLIECHAFNSFVTDVIIHMLKIPSERYRLLQCLLFVTNSLETVWSGIFSKACTMHLTLLEFKPERVLSLTSANDKVGQHQILWKVQSFMLIERKMTEGLILDSSQWDLWVWKKLMAGSCERNRISAIGLQRMTLTSAMHPDMLT